MSLRISKKMAEDIKWAAGLREGVTETMVWELALKAWQKVAPTALPALCEKLEVVVRLPAGIPVPLVIREIMAWYIADLREKTEQTEARFYNSDPIEWRHPDSSAKRIADLERAICIYMREEAPVYKLDFENDVEAIAWFLDNYKEENYV